MSPKAQDYGEPWDYDAHLGLVAEGNVVIHKEGKKRAAACVNALKGCPDPQAFVDAVKKGIGMSGINNYPKSRELTLTLNLDHPVFAWLRKEETK